MAVSSQFRTFQTVQSYEDALARHAQWIRWNRSQVCACIGFDTGHPDPACSVCNGRGIEYREPDIISILQEEMKHDSTGNVYPYYTPITGTPVITRRGAVLPLAASQPSDGSYIILDPPYPKAWERILGNYDFTPVMSVTDENSTVIGTNTLKTIATVFTGVGKTFEGSIKEVTRVYNVTRDETYTVSDAIKEYIYLVSMGIWESGDVLEVDYKYVKPFELILIGISERLRYQQSWILEEAEAILIAPYWVKISPQDLFTVLSAEQITSVVIDPTATAGNDEINGYFDVAKLIRLVNTDGTLYDVDTDVELYGRNEIKWNITKPTKQYSVSFLYHPTFSALQGFPTVRTSENKSFVNKINLKLFDRTSGEFTI